MLTNRANGFNGRSQGFTYAGKRHRTSYPTNTLPLSTQSPVQQLGRMYSANPPNGYRGSPGQAGQCLIESSIHPGYTTQQDHLSGHNGRSYGKVGGPDKGHRFAHREFQEYQDGFHAPLGNKGSFVHPAESYTMYEGVPALQFSDGGGPPAQFRRSAYESRSVDRAVPDDIQDMRNNTLLPLSPPGRNSGQKSLEMPNQQ